MEGLRLKNAANQGRVGVGERVRADGEGVREVEGEEVGDDRGELRGEEPGEGRGEELGVGFISEGTRTESSLESGSTIMEIRLGVNCGLA